MAMLRWHAMRHSRLLTGVILLAGIAGAAQNRGGNRASTQHSAHSTATPRHPQAPDVFLITVDTLRADHVGCYGYRDVQTPALDSLARQGIRFSNAFTPSPITNTSHATILTGLLPSSHGVTDFGVPLQPVHRTWAELLKQRGYATAAFIAAVILDSKTLAPGLDRGFDFYDNFPSDLPKTSSRYGRVERRGMDVVHRAEHWLARHPPAAKPRFVWIHIYDPHDPYDPPAVFARAYAGHLYDGEIAYADSAVAEFLSFLRRHGWYDHALVIAVGDHGEGLGEHGEETHGIFLYDSTLHVPLLVKLPQPAPPAAEGIVVQQQVRTTDILPTVLGMLKINSAEKFDGESLQSLWTAARAQGVQPNSLERVALGETDYPLLFGWSPLKSVRQRGMKYIEAPRPELYDLRADPKETQNLYEPWNEDVLKLRAQLASLRARSGTASTSKSPGAVDPNTIAELKALGYLGNNPGATTAAEPSLLADPKDKIELHNLLHRAMLADEDGDAAGARQTLEKALQIDPDSPVTLTQLGQLELESGNYARAATLLHHARRLRPQDVMAAFYEGEAWYHLGNLESARDAVEASLKLSTGQFAARHLLGKVYAGLKQWSKAEDELEAAQFLQPTNVEVQWDMARVLLAQNRPSEALSHIQRAQQLAPPSAEEWDLIAEAYSALGKKSEAERAKEQSQALRAKSRK